MRKIHCEKFDVIFDKDTGEYLEKGCTDKNCKYCTNRTEDLKKHCKTCNYELRGGIICNELK